MLLKKDKTKFKTTLCLSFRPEGPSYCPAHTAQRLLSATARSSGPFSTARGPWPFFPARPGCSAQSLARSAVQPSEPVRSLVGPAHCRARLCLPPRPQPGPGPGMFYPAWAKRSPASQGAILAVETDQTVIRRSRGNKTPPHGQPLPKP
jgi:hypothetical protein